MKHAPAENLERIRAVGRLNFQGDVALQLFFEPLSEILTRDVLAFAADEWRRVNAEYHLNRGFIDRDARHCAANLDVTDRIADRYVFESDDRGDIAGGAFRCRNSAELIEQVDLDDFGIF